MHLVTVQCVQLHPLAMIRREPLLSLHMHCDDFSY